MAEPAPPSPLRRRLAFTALAGLLLSCLGCGILTARWLTDVGRDVSAWLAGIGDLEWRDVDGGWRTVATADARRRHWGPADGFLAPAWRPAADGLDVAELDLRRRPSPQTIAVVLVRVDPGAWRFRVYGAEDWAERSVAELATEAGLAVAVNAAYFSEEGPLGLVVSDGRRRRRPVAHRAAHFLVDGPDAPPRIVNQKRARVDGVLEGFQGFPAIMTDGRTFGYMRDGGRGFDVLAVDRRTAACVTRDGRVILLVTDSLTNGLTFDELATVLGGLDCDDAMGLDGGSSTGLWADLPGWRREVPNLKPVQVVLGLTPRG